MKPLRGYPGLRRRGVRLFATANGVALYAPRARAAVLSEWTLDQAKGFEAATADD